MFYRLSIILIQNVTFRVEKNADFLLIHNIFVLKNADTIVISTVSQNNLKRAKIRGQNIIIHIYINCCVS